MLARIANPLLPSVYDIVWVSVLFVGALVVVGVVIATLVILRRRKD